LSPVVVLIVRQKACIPPKDTSAEKLESEVHMPATRIRVLLFVALTSAVSVLFLKPAGACTFINVEAAQAGARVMSSVYWAAAGALAGTIFLIEMYTKRWSMLVLAATTALLVFHPRWTVPATYDSACSFLNVQASQAVIVLLAIFLIYELVRVLRRGRIREAE
jgi:hypothetical protein